MNTETIILIGIATFVLSLVLIRLARHLLRMRRVEPPAPFVAPPPPPAPPLVGMVWHVGGNFYKVQGRGGRYYVDLDNGTCSCPGSQQGRGHYCYHLDLARAFSRRNA